MSTCRSRRDKQKWTMWLAGLRSRSTLILARRLTARCLSLRQLFTDRKCESTDRHGQACADILCLPFVRADLADGQYLEGTCEKSGRTSCSILPYVDWAVEAVQRWAASFLSPRSAETSPSSIAYRLVREPPPLRHHQEQTHHLSLRHHCEATTGSIRRTERPTMTRRARRICCRRQPRRTRSALRPCCPTP